MNMADENVLDREGAPLSGEDLEAYCNDHGLCNLCARYRTHKKVFRILKKNKWQALTIKDYVGGFNVYKGYCIRSGCFTLDQARRLLGELGPETAVEPKRTSFRDRLRRGLSDSKVSKKEAPTNNHQRGTLDRTLSGSQVASSSLSSRSIRRDDDDVSVGSARSTNTSVRRSLTQLLRDNAGTVLDLSSTKLQHLHITELVASFSVANTLKTLILENCKLNDNELEMVSQGLYNAKTVPLVRLSLKNNSIGNRGAASMYNWLQSNKTLEELDLSKNQIGSMGANTMITAFRDNGRTRIRMLNLAHNEIWDPDDGSFFSKNTTLQILNLEGNFVNDEGVELLAAGIAANEDTALVKLFLGWNGLGDEGMIALAQMIGVNTSIQVLGLGENEITSLGARKMLSALASNTTLREITGLYRNQIDRKFIIVAMKRLMETHKEQHGAVANDGRLMEITEDGEESLEESAGEDAVAPEDKSHQSLNWEDKLYAPASGEDARPPIGMISTIHVESPIKSRVENEASTDKIPGEIHSATTEAEAEEQSNSNHSTPDDGSESDGSGLDDDEDAPPLPSSFDRLTVFHAAPLAYFNADTAMHHAIPLHDFGHETRVIQNSIKESEKIGGTIEMQIETGTSENLKTFFCEPQSRIIHISTHGHRSYMTLEDGRGHMENLDMKDFSSLVKSGGGTLILVVVSSYHSLSIGKALIEAGIPHVVCCHHAETFRDDAGMTFVRNLYYNLARNKTLKRAFDLAREAVRVEEKSKHVGRYRLLPEKLDEDDNYHDVPIFFTEAVTPRESFEDEECEEALKLLPELPRRFVGREVDMYEILEALRVEDVVRVGGRPGIGKTSAVAAVSRYVLQRRKSFQIDNFFWLPPGKGVIPDEDSLYGDLCQAISLIIKSDHDIWQDADSSAMECRERIELELEGQRTIIAIDGRQFLTAEASQNLENLISHLLNVADIKIVLITSIEGSPSQEESMVQIGPLDFKSTALLFGEVSRYISASGCPAAQSPDEFATLMVPPSVAKLEDQSTFSSQRRTDLLDFMGNGIPVNVIDSASHQIADDFIEMIGTANKPEVQIESFSQLESEVGRWTMQRKMAVNSKNYMRAEDLQSLLEELELHRPNFPSLKDLVKQEKQLQKALTAALEAKQYDTGTAIKRQILNMKRQIMHEKRAGPERQNHAGASNGRLAELKDKMQHMMAMANLSLDDLDYNPASDSSAVYNIGSDYHPCFLRIYNGSVVDFEPAPDAGAIVCWSNECCDLRLEASGKLVAETGGRDLVADVDSLPPISDTTWGVTKCGTGNACIVGPGNYNELGVPCIVLAVGPLCPSCEDECEEDDADQLHYIEIMIRSCIRSALVLSKHTQLQAIAFPTLTTKFGGGTYHYTLQLGLKILVEEAKYSDLSNLHIVASSDDEASRLIVMAAKMGLKFAMTEE
jgi:Ran GTPase-activating protein (RanGAP) involved in mRNA processing and transport